jgi:hypothetical protein
VLGTQYYNPSYSGDRNQEDRVSAQIVHETLSQKYPTQKRVDGLAQVVEHWPRSNPSPTKERNDE